MTGPLDVIGSLNAAVDAYQTAQDAMVAASRELTEADQGNINNSDEQPPGGNDGSVPA